MLNNFGKCLFALLTLGMLAAAQAVPAGTRITVRTDSQINSASAHVGQSFHANLVRDLVVSGKGRQRKAKLPMPSQVDACTPPDSSLSGLLRSNWRMAKLCCFQAAAFVLKEKAIPRAM